MPSLGLIMILLNEENNLMRSLKPVAGLFDQVVVVDTGSIDKTKETARSMGANVYKLKWDDDFSKARNKSIEKAETDYLLWLDGDNAIAPSGVARVRNALESSDQDFIGWCREILEPRGGALIQKRLFPRRPDVFFSGRIHEQLSHPVWLRFVYLDVDILHWGYRDPAAAQAKGLRNLNLLLKSLKSAPDDFFLLYQTGKTLFNLKRYGEAKEYLARARKSAGGCPENPELAAHGSILLGLALERLGEGGALDLFEKATQSGDPGKKLALYHLGRLLADKGEPDQAVENLELFMEDRTDYLTLEVDLDQIRFRASVLLARLHQKQKNIDKSVMYYHKAIELKPDIGFPWRELIRALKSEGRNQESNKVLEKFRTLNPADASLAVLHKELAS